MVATANQTLSHDAKVVMTNLTPSDNGNLELEVENSVGKQTYIFEIKVKMLINLSQIILEFKFVNLN